MRIHLQYGDTGLDVDLPVRPRDSDHAAVRRRVAGRACGIRTRRARPARLRHRSASRRRTRPSSDRHPGHHAAAPDRASAARGSSPRFGHVPLDRVVIVNGTGSHRANTPDELRRHGGRGRVPTRTHREPRRARSIDAGPVGAGEDGHAVSMCRAYVEADRRIVLGLGRAALHGGLLGRLQGRVSRRRGHRRRSCGTTMRG